MQRTACDVKDIMHKIFSRDEMLRFDEDTAFLYCIGKMAHYNTVLYKIVEMWQSYLEGKGEKPLSTFADAFIPKYTGKNDTCRLLDMLCDYFEKFEHGQAKDATLAFMVAKLSRSCITLTQRIMEFHSTEHIRKADNIMRDFFDLIAYEGRCKYTQEQYSALLRKKCELFAEACAENAYECDEYVRKCLREKKRQSPLLIAFKEPPKIEFAGTPEVKLDKKTKQKVDDIYTAAVKGEEVEDGRKMGHIRRKMVAECADLKMQKNISCRKAASEIIKKYAGKSGAYSTKEAKALEKAITRECGMRHK